MKARQRLNSLLKQHEDFNMSCENNDGSSCGHQVVLSTHHSLPPTQYPTNPLLLQEAPQFRSLPSSLVPKMLPRTQSIFHVGDEGWEATKPTAAFGELERSSRGAIKRLEGLRILIQHSVRQSNVVIKSCLKPCTPHHLLSLRASSATQLSFLKTCFLCKTELSPHKDVYMYRGDQGFCSEECRGQQILIDERKEMELLSTRERLKAIHDHRRLRESDRHKRRILVAA